MNSKQAALIVVLALFLVFPVSAEIIVNTGENVELDSGYGKEINVKHSFEVNKYYSQYQEGELQIIMIEPIVSEASIMQCRKANFSFKLTNIAPTEQLYSFRVENFDGLAYITPNLKLNPGNIAQVRYILQPNCNSSGILTPEIVVETSSKKAIVPVVLTVNKTKQEVIDETKCETHFNSTVCDSNYYIRFYEDTKYELDLSEMFYDPDEDELEFGYSNGFNINIKLRDNKATLLPQKNWYGTEEIIFTAEDGRGGYAQSKNFFIHVIDREEISFFQWLSNLFG